MKFFSTGGVFALCLHCCFDGCTNSDAESEKKKAEWREQARRELDDWHKHREEQLDKSKKVNRFVTVRCI